jgi:hypothetical protein
VHLRRRLTALGAALPLLVGGLLLSGAQPQSVQAASAGHPRLLFSAADVASLRVRVAAPGVPAQAWAKLKERAEGHLLKVSPDVVRANIGVPTNAQGLEKPYTLQNEMPTYLIDLGMAYQLSGDERFGRRVIDLLSALGDAGYPYWCCQDLGVGDLDEGLALGFDWTYQLMTPAERTKILHDLTSHESMLLDRMLVHPTHPAARYKTSNWMGVTAGGAGLLALALRGEPGAPPKVEAYLPLAMKYVGTYFRASVDPRGANYEGHTYAYYGIKNAVPFALAARRAGLGDLIAGTGLPNIARWLSFEQMPGEGQNFIPLNDSGRSQYGVDAAAMQFAINPHNGVAQWLWQRTVGKLGDDFYSNPVPDYALEGKCTQNRADDAPASTAACGIFNVHGNVWAILFYRSPTETPEVDPATTSPLSVYYPVRGLVDARTGFARGTGEVVSTFEAHRNGEGHFQYDVGNFTLFGYGGRFATDPGVSCVACGNTSDMGFAIDHNVVVVDGNKNTQYRFLRYYQGHPVNSFVNAATFSLTRADTRYAYDFEPPYADRDHFFGRTPGRPVLVAIGDSLQRDKIPFEKASPNDHTYTWRMNTQFANSVAVSGSGFTVTAPNGATLVGRAAVDGNATADPTFTKGQITFDQASDDDPGFHTVSTVTPPRQRFDQLTVLALTPAGASAATTTTLRVRGGNAVAVDWHGGRDVVVRRLKLSTGMSGPVTTDATMAKYTKNAGDTVLREGTLLIGEAREYVRVTGVASTVTVSGATAAATGRGTQFRVYAPQRLTATKVNGRAVRSCRAGAYVTFPCGGATTGAATAELAPVAEQLPRTGLRGAARLTAPRTRPASHRLPSDAALGIVLATMLIAVISGRSAARRRRPMRQRAR